MEKVKSKSGKSSQFVYYGNQGGRVEEDAFIMMPFFHPHFGSAALALVRSFVVYVAL